MTNSKAPIPNGVAAILARLIRNDLSPEAARSISKLDFEDQDRARMHELAVTALHRTLTGAEEAELASYRGVGRLLELIRSKARSSLKKAGLEPSAPSAVREHPLVGRRAGSRQIRPTSPFDCVTTADPENSGALIEAGEKYQDAPARELADLEAGRHPLQKHKPRRG